MILKPQESDAEWEVARAHSSDGVKIYVAADSAGPTKGAPGTVVQPINKGCIMEFDFTTAVNVSTIPKEKELLLYPNPANGSVTLQLPEGMKAADVRMSNVLGAVVYSGRMTERSGVVNLKGFPAGVYTVSVASDRQTWHRNLIVK